MIRVILNGKKAGLPAVREAISALRNQGHTIEVRVTWEQGDVHRLVREAVREGIPRLVAGGGDGTVNEVSNAVAQLKKRDRPEVAILPLGTANDFATACHIPTEAVEALRLALEAKTTPVDLGMVNERSFLNIATGGFGAQVTTETPVELKNFLGGGAYTLTGIIKALDFKPDRVKVRTPETELELDVLVAAICNGRQAGGGQPLAPDALINDGLLNISLITDFPFSDIDIVLEELMTPSLNGQYVKRIRTPWVEGTLLDGSRQINLDGEPYFATDFRFDVLPGALDLVLPLACPTLAQQSQG